MLTQKTPEKRDRQESDANQQRIAALTANVIAALGRPEGKLRVDVHPLWNNRFRVNVLIGEEATFTRVAHSFFVVTDDNGAIVSSRPPIAREY